MFKANKLEKATRKILEKYLGSQDARMDDPQSSGETCKTIAEAIRATCASVGLFKPVEIVEPGGVKMSYVDGGMGNSNPTPRLLEEAGMIFPGQEVACVISLGAGNARTISVPDSRPFQPSWSSELSMTLMALATDCERTAEEMEERFKNTPGVYFRLSVDQGLGDIGLADWGKDVVSHTWAYLRLSNNDAKMSRAAQALGKDEPSISVERLAGSIPANAAAKCIQRKCPPPSPAFVGRKEPLAQMCNYFFSSHSTRQLLFVLYGLGGSGKSQMAYKFVDLYQDRFAEVIFIDATSKETIKVDLGVLAIVKQTGDALTWLTVQSQNWLMIFNNADDTRLNLRQFFPTCSHGNILVTTRNHRMVTMVQEAEAHYQVSGLSCDDALQLLLKVSQAKGEVEAAGAALVKGLGYLALAIVQAAAYIRVNGCSIHQYHQMYETSRGSLLEEYKDHLPKVDDYELTAHATWRASYRRLSPTASGLFNLFAFMHHSNISEDIFQYASLSHSWLNAFQHGESDLMAADILDHFIVGGAWSKPLFLKCVDELRSYSLVDLDPLTQHYSIHPLVQQWVKTIVQNAEVTNRCVALLLILSWSPQTARIGYCRTIMPHLDVLPERLKTDASLSGIFAEMYLTAGRYKEAETLQLASLRSFKPTASGDRGLIPPTSDRLATIYLAQGRWAEAIRMRLKLVEANHRIFGDNHIDTTRAKDRLAFAYAHHGRWSDAETLQAEVLRNYTNLLGATDPETCAARSLLVMIYLRHGEREKAETLGRAVPKDRILEGNALDKLGPHYFTQIQILAERGKWDEAAALQEELVELAGRIHGAEHEETLRIKRLLTVILLKIPARSAEAEVLARQVAEGYERVFGEDHPEALAAKCTLAVVLGSRKNFAEAEVALREVLEMRQKVSGAMHYTTLSVRLSLGINLALQKRWSEAEALLSLTEELQQALKEDSSAHLDSLVALGPVRRHWTALRLVQRVSALCIVASIAIFSAANNVHPGVHLGTLI
ncbi:hypothetical protein FRC10_006800 [Ceratobasidium sp. 414]|nr:hypothetical protein FRC10_006800 [Ceratobasidium sp. 414]